ncbi:TRAP transporter substrate-binding protein [Roseococcus sp. SYP-B2431]|uniref:TRAP transporter substrate-binding protein n=1 Tax=Roseococcus sp. SYP-B2431 TaxID=2496640 RepID=UPI0013F45BAB|nr:TRAP transporter substrate-binding protein [Roseococcus sp. SYP-B2431]
MQFRRPAAADLKGTGPSRNLGGAQAAGRALLAACFGALLGGWLLAAGAQAQPSPPAVQGRPAPSEPIRIKVIGGLAGVSQFLRYEAPFWQQRLPQITQGRMTADIEPSDRSGIRPAEMLHLMRLGVVPFGTFLLATTAADEPELAGGDLPVLNPDMARLRENMQAYRPRVVRNLADNYDMEVLAIYAYPAQVLFCTRAFTSLSDLGGRRIRTSSVGQADIVTALGAISVVMPFAETVSAVRNGQAECAITGSLSGNAIGLSEVTAHVHRMALTWGLSVFGAHRPSWNALPADLRQILRQGLAELESEIWAAAERETEEGFACNSGQPSCAAGRPGRMQVVPVSEEDERRRRVLLRDVVLPNWIERCGPACADAWNESLASSVGIPARP